MLAELEEHPRGKWDVLMLSRNLIDHETGEGESRMPLQTARTGSEGGVRVTQSRLGNRPLPYRFWRRYLYKPVQCPGFLLARNQKYFCLMETRELLRTLSSQITALAPSRCASRGPADLQGPMIFICLAEM